MVLKYSKLKHYERLGINDTAQIEKYKARLIELHNMGYKRFCYNLKILVMFGKDNDFSEAIKQIQIDEDQRFKKNKERKESRERNKWRKKKNLLKGIVLK